MAHVPALASRPPALSNPHREIAKAIVAVLVIWLGSLGCGYHTAGSGKAVRLPSDIHTIAVPAFQNATTAYHVEQVLTEAVVREFQARSRYRVVTEQRTDADAILHGMVTYAALSPLTYDSATGRVSSALVVIVMRVSLVDRNGKVLYDNPGYTFSSQYQISREPASFFQEEGPALDRVARSFARTLVANVLEAY